MDLVSYPKKNLKYSYYIKLLRWLPLKPTHSKLA